MWLIVILEVIYYECSAKSKSIISIYLTKIMNKITGISRKKFKIIHYELFWNQIKLVNKYPNNFANVKSWTNIFGSSREIDYKFKAVRKFKANEEWFTGGISNSRMVYNSRVFSCINETVIVEGMIHDAT